MANCAKCNKDAGGAAFCPNCGEPTSSARRGLGRPKSLLRRKSSTTTKPQIDKITYKATVGQAPAAPAPASEPAADGKRGGEVDEAAVPNVNSSAKQGGVRTWRPQDQAARDQLSDNMADKSLGALAQAQAMMKF